MDLEPKQPAAHCEDAPKCQMSKATFLHTAGFSFFRHVGLTQKILATKLVTYPSVVKKKSPVEFSLDINKYFLVPSAINQAISA